MPDGAQATAPVGPPAAMVVSGMEEQVHAATLPPAARRNHRLPLPEASILPVGEPAAQRGAGERGRGHQEQGDGPLRAGASPQHGGADPMSAAMMTDGSTSSATENLRLQWAM